MTLCQYAKQALFSIELQRLGPAGCSECIAFLDSKRSSL